MPRTLTLATLLMLAVPGALQAQPRPAQIRGSMGLGAFVEADTHAIAGASWRKYLGTRGWGFEVEGLTMRGGRHFDFQLALDVVKDLAPPDRRTVPYLVIRGPVYYGSNRGTGAWKFAPGVVPAFGVGVTRWSASRRVFIAPEVRVGYEPNLRLSLTGGFALR